MTSDKPPPSPPRQPALTPDRLSPEQRRLYGEITGGQRSGGAFALTDAAGVLQGPFGGFLLSPALGDKVQQLGAAVRYDSRLSARIRELAILAVAGYHQSPFERDAHVAVGRTIGLSEAEMGAAYSGEHKPFDDVAETAALRMTRAILNGDVDDQTWHGCVPPLSVEDVFELLVLVGYYSMLAVQMRVLRVEEPSAVTDPANPASRPQ